MSCADELDYIRRVRIPERLKLLNQMQDYRDSLQQQVMEYGLMIAVLQSRNMGTASQQAAAATAATGPATRPTTQPQEERRVGSGELAQYAALARDIADMEARLDRLEAR